MPIRVNLLAEQIAAEEMRRRDPVKRAYWAAGILIGLVLIWTGLLQVQVSRASSELTAQVSKWKALEPKFKQIDADHRKTTATEARLDALDRLSTNRFLWAKVLNAVQFTMVDGVEVQKLLARQSFETVDLIPGKTNSVSGTTNKVIIPPKPGSSRQKISLTVQGRDISPSPGSQINRFREGIAAHPFFSTELKKVDGVALRNRSPVTADPVEPGRSFVEFTIECQFLETLRTNKLVIR